MIEITSEKQLLSHIGSNGQESLFIFKHSNRCAVSFMTFEEYESFDAKHPEVTCAFITIQEHRDISNKLEEITGITHQSPQVFHYFNGQLKWNTSHGSITEDELEKQLQEKE